MAFYDKRIRDLMTYKIFINCDGISGKIQMISDFAVG
jgi:uridine kinase